MISDDIFLIMTIRWAWGGDVESESVFKYFMDLILKKFPVEKVESFVAQLSGGDTVCARSSVANWCSFLHKNVAASENSFYN